jgi:hydrogenase maturation protease
VSPARAPRVAVVGLGNALARDDALGLEVARRLRPEAERAGIAVFEHEGSPLALLDVWAELDAVVLVDATHGGGAPGTVRRFDASLAPIPVELGRSASTHAVGAGEAIELGRALGRLPGRVVVLGVEGARFNAGRGLSAEVEAALDAVVEATLGEACAFASVRASTDRRD